MVCTSASLPWPVWCPLLIPEASINIRLHHYLPGCMSARGSRPSAWHRRPLIVNSEPEPSSCRTREGDGVTLSLSSCQAAETGTQLRLPDEICSNPRLSGLIRTTLYGRQPSGEYPARPAVSPKALRYEIPGLGRRIPWPHGGWGAPAPEGLYERCRGPRGGHLP